MTKQALQEQIEMYDRVLKVNPRNLAAIHGKAAAERELRRLS